MLTLNKSYFDGSGGLFIVAALSGDVATIYRRPPHPGSVEMSVAEVEEMKAAGERRTFVVDGEQRIIYGRIEPDPPETEPPVWPDGAVQYAAIAGGPVTTVSTGDWDAWLAGKAPAE